MAPDLVNIEVEPGGIASLILGGDKGNAISPQLLQALEEAISELERSQFEILLVKSLHPKVFMVGGDLDLLKAWMAEGRLADSWGRLASEMADLLDRLRKLPAFSIAVIEGDAVGGGLELALCCDYRIIEKDSRLGFPENRLGVFPSAGSLPRLGELVGPGVAIRLVLTGELIDAEAGKSMGLVEVVTEKGEAETEARELAASVLRWGTAPLAVVRDEVRGDWSKDAVYHKMTKLLEGVAEADFFERIDHRMLSRKSGRDKR